MTIPSRPPRRHSQHQSGARRPVLRRAPQVVWAGAFAVLALALASCGGSLNRNGYGTATATPGAASYAYLYSQIDYPLQIPVSASDTVTLTLSPQSYILSATPGQGRGTGTVGQPIPLPTDLENYRDVAASVDTQAGGAEPLSWALTSPVRQSLLAGSSLTNDRRYKEKVTFKWDVRASAPGENTVRVVLHLIYVYLDGSEHDGTIEVSQAPIPIAAVQSGLANTTLPQFKLPLAGLSGLAGFIALLRFIYTALKTISDVTEPVKDAAKVANTVRGRVGALQQSGGRTGALRPTHPPLPRYGPTFPPAPGRGGQPPTSPTDKAKSRTSQRPWPPMPGR